MKIALIWTNCNISYPPKGWGAIEKYIWEYKINLEKYGHTVDLKYSNDSSLTEYDIVQCHTWNQCVNLIKANIPYIYSFDDSHVIYYGKESELYKNNLIAMNGAICTIVHSQYLIEWFGINNMIYLRHGANPDIFKYLNIPQYEHKLLCIGKTDQNDRKGFGTAVEVAISKNLPITIVGPNEEFLNDFKYEKLNIIGNSDDEELVQIYNDHTIFLHPSKLETGHPNLTLIESIYCGLPVVGVCNEDIDGLYQSDYDFKGVSDGIDTVMGDYDNYQLKCFKTYKNRYYDWYEITYDLVEIYKNL